MLFAAKEELLSDTRVRLLAIKNRELDWLMKNCYLIANLSALISGYGYTALLYTKYMDNDLCEPQEPLCAEMTYPVCVTITFCFGIFSLFATMVITLLTPALALRGPQGSVSLCIDIAIQEYQYALVLFTGSLIMLLVSAAIWSMSTANLSAAAVITIVMFGTCILIFLTSRKTLKRFDAPQPPQRGYGRRPSHEYQAGRRPSHEEQQDASFSDGSFRPGQRRQSAPAAAWSGQGGSRDAAAAAATAALLQQQQLSPPQPSQPPPQHEPPTVRLPPPQPLPPPPSCASEQHGALLSSAPAPEAALLQERLPRIKQAAAEDAPPPWPPQAQQPLHQRRGVNGSSSISSSGTTPPLL